MVDLLAMRPRSRSLGWILRYMDKDDSVVSAQWHYTLTTLPMGCREAVSRIVGTSFDMLGFDPRGTGWSTPLAPVVASTPTRSARNGFGRCKSAIFSSMRASRASSMPARRVDVDRHRGHVRDRVRGHGHIWMGPGRVLNTIVGALLDAVRGVDDPPEVAVDGPVRGEEHGASAR
ncbi:hypothetical protein C8Q76DRAFT_49144 [Earliella scabrosa]|nr:hypothetical protein C8Q76DRAFT_49144 [Earliella scabrosa]